MVASGLSASRGGPSAVDGDEDADAVVGKAGRVFFANGLSRRGHREVERDRDDEPASSSASALRAARPFRAAIGVAVAAVVASAYLGYLMVVRIGALCPTCVTIAGLNLLIVWQLLG
jgi:hypothetical protein